MWLQPVGCCQRLLDRWQCCTPSLEVRCWCSHEIHNSLKKNTQNAHKPPLFAVTYETKNVASRGSRRGCRQAHATGQTKSCRCVSRCDVFADAGPDIRLLPDTETPR